MSLYLAERHILCLNFSFLYKEMQMKCGYIPRRLRIRKNGEDPDLEKWRGSGSGKMHDVTFSHLWFLAVDLEQTQVDPEK
jgi:hypothetical protein